MSGQPVPSLLSNLLSDLGKEIAMPDMEASLPWDQSEIKDFQALMQIPEGFGEELEDEADEAERDAPKVLTIVLDNQQWVLWERAIEHVTEKIGSTRSLKARTLEELMRAYLDSGDHSMSELSRHKGKQTLV